MNKQYPLDKESFLKLSQKNNLRPSFDFFVHFSLLVFSGYGFVYFFSESTFAWSFVFFYFYAFFLGFLGWAGAGHEFSHGTAFKSKWLNDFALFICSCLTLNNPVYFKKTHRIHHLHTYESGVDLEVEWDKNVDLLPQFNDLFVNLGKLYRTYKALLFNCFGLIPGVVGNKLFSEKAEKQELIGSSRKIIFVQISVHIAFLFFELYALNILFFFAPFSFLYFNRLLSLAQHYGKSPDSKDFKVTTRSVRLNPILSLLYWNMNFHIEHHIYPSIPYYNLPLLQQKLAMDEELNRKRSLWSIFKELKACQMNYKMQPLSRQKS